MTAPHTLYGTVGTDFDAPALNQLLGACRLPVAVRGALMPDAHVGYGLPIGGVLATRNAVIPYAVGVDIACRVKLSVFDIAPRILETEHGRDKLRKILESETSFGIGAKFDKPRDHPVMDRDWSITKLTQHYKDKARTQLGTSGSGNHFVEWGTLTIREPDDSDAPSDAAHPLGLEPGVYLALLSHSGSRGTGAAVCDYYSKLAMESGCQLNGASKHLSYLSLDSEPGQEYWAAMNLMGEYAHANHEVIHRTIARALGEKPAAGVENHHNFAWKETHTIDTPEGPREEELIVHRKGATPAGKGTLGIIPGSMATPGYVVVGKGEPGSLDSAAHGAGRVMSRSQAKKSLVWGNVRKRLNAAGVELLSAGIDEAPEVYKDIETVMARQTDLVEPIARFDPRIVKMAPAGEKPED